MIVTISIEPIVKPMYISYVVETNNEIISQGEPLVISYYANQPMDPQL